MTWLVHNFRCSPSSVLGWLLTATFTSVCFGQTFVSPQLPAARTLDGQVYGDPQRRISEGQSFQGQVSEGQFSHGQSSDSRIVDGNSVLGGRIFEGRVLTGPDGQPGDMTLRFPDNDGNGNTTFSTSQDGSLVFGPIEIEPNRGSRGSGSPENLAPPQGVRRQETSLRRKRKPDLQEITNREIIRQRYPEGNIHIARHVMQDAEGNWVNDGQWKLFDRQGAMIASGSYRNGAMDGKWSRLHTAGSGGLFGNAPFIEFDGPYASHATFEGGKLSGVWEIRARSGQKIFEMPYKNGRRNGIAVWYLPQNKIHRRMEFKDDVPTGNLVEFDRQGKVSRKEIYKDGMKIVNNITYYRPSGQKQQESIVRKGRLELQGDDDWWEARPAPMVVTGEDVQHGPIRSWYENGQTKMVGNLVDGVRVGKFAWWHRNGTKQLVGQYDRSGQKTGQWRWWHANGIRSIMGGYVDGEADGVWKWWNDQGEVVNTEDFDLEAQPEESEIFGSETEDEEYGNLDDAFGESLDEDSILDDMESDPAAADELEFQTDDLEGIEPESDEFEEIPEPTTARRYTAPSFQTPQIPGESNVSFKSQFEAPELDDSEDEDTEFDDADVNAFFLIRDDG